MERETRPCSCHINNLLVNPHEAIRDHQCQEINKSELNTKCHAAGERWWGPEALTTSDKEILLGAQPPFLNGGEGELQHAKSSLPVIIGGGENLSGLKPPTLDSTGGDVTGADTPQHRIENKRRRRAQLASQPLRTKWTRYQGEYELPDPLPELANHRGEMCPSGLALHHPAAPLLKEWATYGCPTNTGRPWKREETQEAIDRGPHRSALSEEAIAHFKAEVNEKIKVGQAKLVSWDSIKESPPENLKISPIAAIPHKSKQFRSILDLSFHLRLKQGGVLPSVNSTTVKTAPKGAIDQLGHSLSRIIHAFAETKDDAVIFMAKWDINSLTAMVSCMRPLFFRASC